jgi:phosphate transport system substrate-binding protein
MKKVFLYIMAISVLAIAGCGSGNNKNEKKGENLKGTITISGAFALYPLAVKWAEEFMKIHPAVKVDVSAGGAGKGMTDALSGMVNLGMVSRDISKEEADKGAWFVPVTKDAVVPVISENNPDIQKLMNQGVTKEVLEKIFITGKITNWGEVSGDKKVKDKINVYTRADACGAADVWAKYLGKKQEDLIGTAVSGDPGVTQAVKNDKLGIGFNNIGYAYDSKSKYEVTGIKVLPIDFNGNGRIDDNEFFYQHKDSIVKAIADGRYPSPPARDLYFVCKGQPKDEVVIEFLKWVLTDGQKFVNDAGYINLTNEKIAAALKKLQ